MLGLGAFFLALLVHLVLWSIRVPHSVLPVFAAIFSGVYAVACAVYLLSYFPVSVWGFVYWTLLYMSLTATYVLTYNGVVYDSPALAIVRRLAEGGREGVSDAELHAFMRSRPFVESRLAQMCRDEFIFRRDGRIELADKSVRLLRVFDWFRAVLGRQSGGG